jgi:tRNA dimethylallyltransferase
LATRFNGEIVNGDAMQMYDDLPIITNKITVKEQNGIPHHLLGIVRLHEEPWRVSVFKKKAVAVIKEIRSRGRLPILVGGTHYYTQSLLLNESLVVDTGEGKGDAEHELSREEINRRFPILEKPTSEILEELRKVDPVMANRWHPNDRRKLQRSLEIYLLTGKQASQIYQEQTERKLSILDEDTKANVSSEQEPSVSLQSTLVFWVHVDSEVLKSRLNIRVDKMVECGLVDEVTTLGSFLNEQTAAGKCVDRSSGIWVSIGFKEFEPYIKSQQNGTISGKDLETIFTASIEQTKAATRQYARRQVRWIRNKLLSALSCANSLDSLYLLDGSDLDCWLENVSNQASKIVGRLLAGEELPSPHCLSPAALELLTPKRSFELSDRRDLWIRQVCDTCNMTAVTEEQWQLHLKSRGHRRAVKKSNDNGSQDKLTMYKKGITTNTKIDTF